MRITQYRKGRSNMEPHEKLEVEIGEWMGYPPENVVACSSGTAALHLALEALNILPWSEVVVPNYTQVACARAVALANLIPRFIGYGADLLMSPATVGYTMCKRVSALMAVHIYGRRCDMDALAALSKTFNVPMIEDLAEAHGVVPHPDTEAACWSFYKNKIVAGEEGGAIAFKDKHNARHARSLRCLGFTEAHDFNHIPRGHNYRLAPSLAEKISVSLRFLRMGATGGKRRRVEALYDGHCPVEWKMPEREAPWVYDLRIPGMTSTTQDRIVEMLNKQGIAARHGFKLMSSQREFKSCEWHGIGEIKPSEIIYLPIDLEKVTQDTARVAFDQIVSYLSLVGYSLPSRSFLVP